MKTPKALNRLALFFHIDALAHGRTIEAVLCEFTRKSGVRSMRKVQSFMAESLATGDLDLMIEQWENADSSIDFEEDTAQFFQRVVDFDAKACASSKGKNCENFR